MNTAIEFQYLWIVRGMIKNVKIKLFLSDKIHEITDITLLQILIIYRITERPPTEVGGFELRTESPDTGKAR